jgi:hypothetical protein
MYLKNWRNIKMQKPNGYETAATYGNFTPLELGGHVCKVMSVEETKSSKGKDMLKISLDIAEGPQKGYYADQFRNSTFENKKWGCIVYQLVNDNDGNTNKGLKTFLTSVEESNLGFKTVWGDTFCQSLKGKLVGGIFGREQYENRDGDLKWSTKCSQFRSVETIKKGVEIPKDKLLTDGADELAKNAKKSGVDFYEVNPDEKMPWDE